MTEQPAATVDDELGEERAFEVSLITTAFARSPLEAYLMMVDSLIRYGTDQFHPIIADQESGERYLLTRDGQLVTGTTMKKVLEEILAEQGDAATE